MAHILGNVDNSSPLPLYHQVKSLLLKNIHDGIFNPGDTIPTEAELMEQLNVSRNTIRQAVGDLVQDGYLYKLKSKGTFVSKPKITLNYMTQIESFAEQVEKSGLSADTEVLKFDVITDSNIASELKLSPAAKIIRLFRVRSVGNEPIVIVESYLPYDLCSFILACDLKNESLFGLLARDASTKVKCVERTVEAIAANAHDSKLLEIDKGFPLQSFVNYAYTANNMIVEYCISKYKGNRNKFTIKVYDT